jgi:hypothetical protein
LEKKLVRKQFGIKINYLLTISMFVVDVTLVIFYTKYARKL